MPPQSGRGRRFRPPTLILEFEPRLSEQLTAEAVRTFGLSLVTAAVLMVAGGVVWRLSQRREEFQRRLEHHKRLSVLGEMAAVLAHEIRNPLASLKGHAQLLSERLPAEGAERHKADRIVAEAGRLEALTTNLLDFARTAPASRASIDPAQLVRQSIEDLAPARIELDAGQAPSRWLLDPAGMRQVLTNVLQNAVQASPPDAPVTVAVAIERRALVFTIRDNGPGLAPGQEEVIFEPFVTTRATGAGLGLSVALRIVRLHGGTITASNHPGGGAVFRISIPKE
jgi:two-component system sensor histidine kinase HydH